MWAMSAFTDYHAGSVSRSSQAPNAQRFPDSAYKVLITGSEKNRAGGLQEVAVPRAIDMTPLFQGGLPSR